MVRRRLSRFLRFFVIAIVGVEILLRVLSGLLINPEHLLHGTPYFADLRAGIFDFQGERLSGKFRTLQTKIMPVGDGEFIKLRINKHGFRGKDFQEGPHPQTVRVVSLGSSSTFGFFNRDDETYPAQLEARLNNRCSGEVTFEVYNLGVPYAVSSVVRHIFFGDALKFKPDVVTFYQAANNTGIPYQDRETVWKKLDRTFLIAHYLYPVFADRQRFTRDQVYEQIEAAQARYIDDIDQIAKHCASEGIEFLPATQQMTSLRIPKNEREGVGYEEELALIKAALDEERTVTAKEGQMLRHALLMNSLRAWSKEQEIPLVDGVLALDAARNSLSSWVHLDAKGNALLARAFADSILRRFCPSGRGEESDIG